MPRAPVRRGQIISPFGIGGMLTAPDGVSIIGAGLDHWYQSETGTYADDPDEFQIREWRLQEALDVDFFRLPPDFRRPYAKQRIPNSGLTVPYLRFPLWHVCPRCSRLLKVGLTTRNRVLCPHCKAEGYRRGMHQVPFIAMCDAGHVQDFPFYEWVHREINPHCGGDTLWLYAVGSASLSGQQVKCSCGTQRSLSRITVVTSRGENTVLTDDLEQGARYTCRGLTPWLGTTEPASCGRPLRGSLRSASNVYFSHETSAIYLPREASGTSADLITLLEEDPVLSTFIHSMTDAGGAISPTTLRRMKMQALQDYSDHEITQAIEALTSHTTKQSPSPSDEDQEVTFRRPEFAALRRKRDEPHLLIRPADLSDYDDELALYLSRLSLIDKLKETRAFTGFTRVRSENGMTIDERKAMLWRSHSTHAKDWLPAYVVHGEGIYLELDEGELRGWEARSDVAARMIGLIQRNRQAAIERGIRERPISARMVLLHTFAHLLMLRLTFECGYSTSSLRERLYVSTSRENPMAGILIYTAAGDAEGTMGGLVRMGKPGNLEPVFRRALEMATWCSADPICMEIATQGGQGPSSLNMAACHGCALVPETACELFNSYLDRGLLIGDPENSQLGFFGALL